jgi:hypothetical protein
LQPEEVWYSGDSLKFVIDPDLAFQLENMPYRLAARGQGLIATAAVTFVWPLELEVDEGATGGERRVVGGTRVGPAPKAPPQPASVSPPPPLPELGHADLPIPDMPIPDIGGELGPAEDDSLTRAVPLSHSSHSSGRDKDNLPTRVVAHGSKPAQPPMDAAPTRRVEGRIVSTPLGSEERVFGPRSLPKALSEPIVVPPEPPRAVPPRPAPEPALPPPDAVSEARRSKSGLILAGVIALAAAAGIGGWWWFVRITPTPESTPMAPPVERPVSIRPTLAPEPVPAPEPRPAPEPAPAPEPRPAPEPAPASRLKPEPAPRPDPTPASPRPVPASPPGSRRNLEDELKSQFDPTLQDLEKGLRR